MATTTTVDINPDGTVSVSVDGVKGPSCQDHTAAIEAAIGTVTSCKKTADYHRKRTVKATQKVRRDG